MLIIVSTAVYVGISHLGKTHHLGDVMFHKAAYLSKNLTLRLVG